MPTSEPAFTEIPIDSGVTLHHRRSDRFKTELVRIFFRGDLSAPRAEQRLFAALLQRGTKRFPTLRELTGHLQDLYGAGYGVSSSRVGGRPVLSLRSSTVSGRYLPDRPKTLESLIVLIRDALEGPPTASGRLDPDTFEQERRNLLREYEGRVNNKNSYAVLRLREEMFPKHPWSAPSTGNPKEIQDADPVRCLEAGLSIVAQGEVDIYVLAPCTPSHAERMVKRHLRLPGRRPEHFKRPVLPPPRARPKTFQEELDVVQSRVAVGFRLRDWRLGEGRYVGALADTVLGGGSSSRLFQEVREKRSLCYDIRSSFDPLTGTLCVTAGVDRKNVKATVAAVRAEVKRMGAGEIEASEVSLARRGLLTALEGVADSQATLADFFFSRRVMGRTERTVEEVAAGVCRVSRRGIAEMMARAELDTVFTLVHPKGES